MYEEIVDLLNDWLLENYFDDVTTRYSADFFYCEAENVIEFSLLETPKQNKLFMEFCFDNGLKYDMGSFLMSFLHELGHHETLFAIDELTYNDNWKTKMTLTNSEEDMIKYYNLEVEKEATLWAIDFANENRENLEILQKNLLTILNK